MLGFTRSSKPTAPLYFNYSVTRIYLRQADCFHSAQIKWKSKDDGYTLLWLAMNFYIAL